MVRYKLILVLLFTFLSLQVISQDLIYKKNGEIIKATITENFLKSITYKIPSEIGNHNHYLSVSAIDSIVFRNGKTTKFSGTNLPHNKSEINKLYNNHHLIGFDLAGLTIYKNYTFSYEFLPGKATYGFKVAYTQKNNKNKDYYNYIHFTPANDADWSLSLGTNVYIFSPGTFRIGTGIHYLFGEYSPPKIMETYPNYNTYDNNIRVNKKLEGALFSVFGFFNITKDIATNLGLDLPIAMNPASSLSIRCEVLFNF
jgi:hypothetical protein